MKHDGLLFTLVCVFGAFVVGTVVGFVADTYVAVEDGIAPRYVWYAAQHEVWECRVVKQYRDNSLVLETPSGVHLPCEYLTDLIASEAVAREESEQRGLPLVAYPRKPAFEVPPEPEPSSVAAAVWYDTGPEIWECRVIEQDDRGLLRLRTPFGHVVEASDAAVLLTMAGVEGQQSVYSWKVLVPFAGVEQ